MDSKHDKALIDLFVEEFNRWHNGTFRVQSQPDLIHRDRKAIDALAVDETSRILAVEHTLVEPFEDAKRDGVPFRAVLGPLQSRRDLCLPGWTIMLSVAVGAVPRGVDWKEATIKLEEWVLRSRPEFPEGVTELTVEGCGFPLSIVVEKSRRPGGPGHFLVGRLMPTESVAQIVNKALRDKLPKLSATAADLRVLLCEMDSPARGWNDVAAAIEAKRPTIQELQDITEVWVARTTAWQSENFISWHLIWPLQKANDFQRGFRHEA